MKIPYVVLFLMFSGFFIDWPYHLKENLKKPKTDSLYLGILNNENPEKTYQITHSKISTELKTEGLNYEIEVMDIYIGNFSEVPWQRDDIQFGLLLNSYINTFAEQCDSYLPDNKEMLYGQECAEKQITKNGYGMIISETCIRYRQIPLYLYVAPDMARAKDAISEFELKWMGEMIQSSDGLGNSVKLMSETKAIQLDMVKLLQMNSCDSPGLKRFQENLRRFAHGAEPIKLEKLIAKRKTNLNMLSKEQNIQKLMEDLVYQNSKQWNFNKYHQGSLKNVSILSRDMQGRPQKVEGSYSFSGFGGTKNGSVTLTFNNKGLPDCLYFFDFPTTCRPANRKIAMAYAKNDYGTSNSNASNETTSTPYNIQKENFRSNISTNQQVEDVPFAVIEEPPLYPSCEGSGDNSEIKKCTSEKINQLVNKNFNLALAKELGLSGINRIIVQFRINPNGEVEDIRARAPHPNLEKEAKRVVNLIPRMTPGRQRGKIVGVMYSLPITFNANNNKEPSNKNLEPSQHSGLGDPSNGNPNNNQLRNLFKLKNKKDNNQYFYYENHQI